MAKKRKKTSSKGETEKKPEEKTSKKNKKETREDILVENFVGLQKAMTNLSIKFEGLSEQIIQLLKIFEEAAKNFMEGGTNAPAENKDLLTKIDSLLEQNKTIAKGLVIMEEKIRNREALPKSFSQNFSQPERNPSPPEKKTDLSELTKPFPTKRKPLPR